MEIYIPISLGAGVLLVFSFSCLYSTHVYSEAPFLMLEGRVYPGSMLSGTVTADVKSVKIFDRDVYVDRDRHFVFGLGRDIKGDLDIHVALLKGGSRVYTYEVEPRSYRVQRIEGVAKKYVSPPQSVLDRIRKENASVAQARNTFSYTPHFRQGFVMPAKGPITGVYGSQRVFNGVPKRPHFGLDVAGPVGQPVYAPAPGQVSLVNNDMYYSGGTLLVDHGQGVSSTFIHLSKIVVKLGDKVEAGQKIAEIGATGRVTGPHLDWRVNWFNQRLDPQLLVGSRLFK